MTEDIMEIETQLRQLSHHVEQALDYWLPAEDLHPAKLHMAMRYSVLQGGKRIRPALVYATGQALGIPLRHLNGSACSVELIHAYSLIHDDLPAMDNDELRRGKPTCHKAFDEATAILAGDAIQALAFYILAHDEDLTLTTKARIKMIQTLAQAAGSRGMAGGQAIDLAAVGQSLNIAELEDMHIHKTGALIHACVMMATYTQTENCRSTLQKLDQYAKCIGLAFQIHDDILDVEGDTETLGKPQGSDSLQNKPTYPALLGLKEAKARADTLYNEAIDSLMEFDARADLLRDIAYYIVKRLK